MSEIINYKIEIVERTRAILKENFEYFKAKDREVTFLLNCLLGLIVAVNEDTSKSNQYKKGKIEDLIDYVPDRIGFLKNELKNKSIALTLIDRLEILIGHKKDLRPNDKIWLLCKIRNGIAHQHIEGISYDGIWEEVRLWNVKDDFIDFEIIFTIDELRKFAIKIADDYLNRSDKT